MRPDDQHRQDDAGHIGVVVVHGVADAEQGANLDALVDTMHEYSLHGFVPDGYNEIHRLFETPSTPGSPKERPVIVRRGSINPGTKLTFAEVYWADTTRVSTAKFAALIAAFRVIFEAHYFIDALIDRGSRKWGAEDLLARLLYLATGLIRGPIAGMNIALLSVAAIYLYGQSILQLADTRSVCSLTLGQTHPECVVIPLHIAVLLMMCALAAGSAYTLVKSRREGDIASLEVSVWATSGIGIGALALGIAIFCDRLYGTKILAGQGASTLAFLIFLPLALLWVAFGLLVLGTFVFVLGMAIRTPDLRIRRGMWLALALIILQAYIWSILIAVPTIPLLAIGKLTGALPPPLQALTFDFGLNYLGILIVACIALWVMKLRSRATSGGNGPEPGPHFKKSLGEIQKQQGSLLNVARHLPRLIINRNILVAIVASGLCSIIIRLTLERWPNLASPLTGNLLASLAVTLLVTAIAVLLYFVLDTKTFVNFIHIARDLIDHQYKPSLSFVYRLLPSKSRKAPDHPRRQRLLSRLESTVKFLEEQGCRSIVFVAHSQGTIIVYEYLKHLPRAAQESANSRAVVTFGSPLKHLYENYFHDYANVGNILDDLQARVASWTNLNRIDDPIGNSISDPRGWVTNIIMETGGHTNYWVEPAVAQAIEQSINNRQHTTISGERSGSAVFSPVKTTWYD